MHLRSSSSNLLLQAGTTPTRPGCSKFASDPIMGLEPCTMLTEPSEPPMDPTSSNEMCHFFSAIFLFRELSDMALVKNWVMNKIKMELEEMLQTKMTGKVFEEFNLREVYWGNVSLIFKAIWPVVCIKKGCPKELGFEMDLEYNGSFNLATNSNLVFGKSAYFFIKISRVMRKLKLVFTHLPFTCWSFLLYGWPSDSL